MRVHIYLSVPCLFLFLSRADAHFGYGLLLCKFSDTSDVVYLEQVIFNKVLLIQYNSTVGKYFGYTEKTQEIAAELNKNKALLKQAEKNRNKCKSKISLAYDVLSESVEPTVKVRLVEAAGDQYPEMLVCSAYNFYPKHIKLTWLRNGKVVTSAVTSTGEMSNGNWLYQIHSHLEVIPAPGEKISCMVEHASLFEPKFYDYESITPSDRNKIAVGTAGLVLGFIFVVGALLYYKKKRNGRELVPTDVAS